MSGPRDPLHLFVHKGVPSTTTPYVVFYVSPNGAEAVSAVGSRSESYDNVLAETVNGLHKAEPINRHGLWRSVEKVELAITEWVYFWNTQRLHSVCGDIPPTEFEAACHQRRSATIAAA